VNVKIGLDGVTTAFGDSLVSEDLDLEVREHELLCIVGTSGGGKTTLLRAIGGLLAPRAGHIRIDGRQVQGPDPSVALIFQHFGLFPWKTVRSNVEYGVRVQGREPGDGVVDRLLASMDLGDWADAYPYQLSGGMQQRVGIARAFAVEPDVLLMDEPFSALDAITREQLQLELLRLWREHTELTAVLVTHDIDEAMLLGDRIVVLRGRPGRVGMDVEVPFERPRDPAAIRFQPEYPELRQKVWEALEGDTADGGGRPGRRADRFRRRRRAQREEART
jgi:NitT/TauT family transport system ATP-binding protein